MQQPLIVKPRNACHHAENKALVLDRFIHPRPSTRVHGWSGRDSNEDTEDTATQSILERNPPNHRRVEYRRMLQEALFEAGPGDRVLPLWLGGAPGVTSTVTSDRHWPVRPRRNPLMGPHEVRLALPDVPSSQHTRGSTWWLLDQLVDWGPSGMMAVAGKNDVYLWHVGDEEKAVTGASGATELLAHFDDGEGPLALCWSPRPNAPLLAIGTKGSYRLEMWDCRRKTQLFSRTLPDRCPITAIAWHPFEDVLAIGTALGCVHIVTPVLSLIRTHKFHVSGVRRLAFSPNGGFLAGGGSDGLVLVWDWSVSKGSGMKLDVRSTVTALSWHPWQSSMLAIGSLAGDITLMNFGSGRVTSATYKDRRDQPISVTALAFAPLTAELVVALGGTDVAQVLVLSDLKTILERVEGHNDSVRHLCWSPDGAVLATVGSDEMLCVWNFLGLKATKELRQRELQQAREVRSGVKRQFGCIIR